MFYRISPRIRFVDEPEGDKVPDVLPDVTPDKVVDEAPVAAPAADDLGERVERIEHAVTDLTETVAALAPIPGVDPDPSDDPEPVRDESPASVPWTHKKLFGH